MAKRRSPFKKITIFSDAHERWPIVTCVLIGICVTVFIIQSLVPREVWREYAFIPMNALLKPWIFVTSIFMHLDINHLMFNLFGIAFFGYYVETAVGRRGLLMSFFLAGILSKSGTILTIPAHAASMGASAAIMGVLGFLAVIDPLHPVRFFTILHHPAISFVIIFGVLNLIGLFYPAGPIGYAAHLSGLIVGILLGIHWRNIKKIKIE